MIQIVRGLVAISSIGFCLLAGGAFAQAMPSQSCLSAAQMASNRKLSGTQRRTTAADDPRLIFDPNYFVGSWSFEWDAPDSPLGPGGPWTGRVVFTHTGGCSYQGQMTGRDGAGDAFTRLIRITFDPERRQLSWLETDSHGYTFMKAGPIGPEVGGAFVHHWDHVPAVTIGGASVRIKGATIIASMTVHRYDMQMASDTDDFTQLGSMVFRKENGERH